MKPGNKAPFYHEPLPRRGGRHGRRADIYHPSAFTSAGITAEVTSQLSNKSHWRFDNLLDSTDMTEHLYRTTRRRNVRRVPSWVSDENQVNEVKTRCFPTLQTSLMLLFPALNLQRPWAQQQKIDNRHVKKRRHQKNKAYRGLFECQTSLLVLSCVEKLLGCDGNHTVATAEIHPILF